jgi:hypothetical protein
VSLHEFSSDNRIWVVNFATSKNLTVKSTMFPHCIIDKFTWTSPDGKTHNEVHDTLIRRRQHSNILDVRSSRAADCDTDHYLVVTISGRDWQWVNKQRTKFICRG